MDDTEPGYKQFCKALCDQENTCVGLFTLATRRQCERDCMTDSQVLATREEGLYLAAACMGDRPCRSEEQIAAMPSASTWTKSAEVSACRAQASEDLETTPECIRYCDVIVPAQEECAVPVTEASCRQTACLYEAAVLDEAAKCAEVSDCEEQATCIATALP